MCLWLCVRVHALHMCAHVFATLFVVAVCTCVCGAVFVRLHAVCVHALCVNGYLYVAVCVLLSL